MNKQTLKKCFFLPAPLAGALGAGMGCALGWVFLNGHEERWFAYPIYAASFYALTVLCLCLVPRLLRWAKKPPQERRIRLPLEAPRDFTRSLGRSLLVNVGYGGFHLLVGRWQGSWWMASNGIYYLVNAAIFWLLVGCQRRIRKLEDDCRRQRIGWRVYELCGWLLLALNLAMSGLVFQIIWQGHGEHYPGLLVFAAAAYTFCKLTIAIGRVIQCRKNRSPILGAARNLDLIEAMMSLFQLQTGLFAAFGQDFRHVTLMNCLTGGTICLLVVLGALGMVLHGRKRRSEVPHGT